MNHPKFKRLCKNGTQVSIPLCSTFSCHGINAVDQVELQIITGFSPIISSLLMPEIKRFGLKAITYTISNQSTA
jgi:hypothetical protein